MNLFLPAGPRSVKFACSVCGRTGYRFGTWMEACERGHAPCANGCGRMLSVKLDGEARKHPRGWCSLA